MLRHFVVLLATLYAVLRLLYDQPLYGFEISEGPRLDATSLCENGGFSMLDVAPNLPQQLLYALSV